MIKVIDSIMGTGKTTYVFNTMRSNQDKRWLYISLFLDEVGDGNSGEIGRIQRELPEMHFKMPKNTGDGKVEGLKQLIQNEENIASTHALFCLFDSEVVDLLVDMGYTLVIDEAVDCVSLYEGVNLSDVQAMLASEMIQVSPDYSLTWNEVKYPNHNGKYSEVRDYCGMGSLYLYKNKVLVWEYPPKLLKMLGEVYIVSYLFKGSMMSCWLRINGIGYSFIDNQEIGLEAESLVKARVRQNLEIVRLPKFEAYRQKETAFSSGWYQDNLDKNTAKWLRSVVQYCLKKYSVKVDDVFWTCFKSCYTKLKGKGYSRGGGELSPFLACNTKATNKYKDRQLCVYMVNIYKNPVEVSYLRDKGVEFDRDTYALSEMIQFIWRGCIREGKPMKVLVLSKRMRTLLENWVNE